ncbi:DUF2059 domain-containing protein [Psychroserpens luteus]|uniref:DUF2059 domain-containing protein n=1 Tax=Psychroserpens luteus TaxID=1434066 RepID=A0ABW5ZVG6_9FLAO|nr:DUF2059 domain-containing protein [Psychroserpens luteus]|tara:strand:- start:1459 stop:1863 length:405 start_codon:yes stop_codon:yes gene_type:complete
MKKLLFAIAFICTLTIQAQDNSEFKTQTIEFIQLTGTADAFNNAISQIGAMVPADKKEAYTKEANGTLDDLYSKLADVYMKEFTEEDINELVVFYKTDLGKKLASKQTQLVQSGMAIGQTWGMELSQIAGKYAN